MYFRLISRPCLRSWRSSSFYTNKDRYKLIKDLIVLVRIGPLLSKTDPLLPLAKGRRPGSTPDGDLGVKKE